MDLLEVRKKAKEAKEAKAAEDLAPKKDTKRPEKAAPEAPGVAEAAAPEEKEPVPNAEAEEAAEAPPAKAVDNDAPPQEQIIPAPAPSGKVELLAFMLADEEYALRMDEAKEIIRWRPPTRVPRAPGHIIGIISLRGIILPVFDIRERLGLDVSEPSRYTRIIVVSDGGSTCGLLVDKVTGVTAVPRESIEPPPAVIGGTDADYLDGVGRSADRFLILINVSKALSA